MPIIDDFDGIAKRLRELKSAAPKGADEIGELEKWRDRAMETAGAYVQSRRQGPMSDFARKPIRPMIPRRVR